MQRTSAIAEAPIRLDKWLVALGFDAPRAAELISGGAVYLDGRRERSAATVVAKGVKLTVVRSESGRSVSSAPSAETPLEVLFEDEAIIAVVKPAGIVSQPTPAKVGDSLLDLVSKRLGHEAGLVHRLDRETSGVMVFGKNKAGTSALAKAFREGTARKRYLALVPHGAPESQRIELPLSRDPSRPGRWRASLKHHGIEAITELTRFSVEAEFDLLSLEPLTGRTHQLRAHLAGIGSPIAGDTLYGGTNGPRCLLHAERLEVLGHTFHAPLPDDFRSRLSAETLERLTPRR